MRHSNSFSVVNGRLSSQEFGVGAEIKNAKSELYSKVTLWKMIQTVTQYYRARFICITNDVRKYNECHIKTTGMRRTSSRRSISLYPGQNGRCTFLIEKFLVRMSSYLTQSTQTQMVKIMEQHGKSDRSSWTKSLRLSFDRTIMGKVIRENTIRTRLGKIPNWKTSSWFEKKDYSCLCMWMI